MAITSVIPSGINCVSVLTVVLLYSLEAVHFCSWHSLFLMLVSQCCQYFLPSSSAPLSSSSSSGPQLPRHKRTPRTRSSPVKSLLLCLCSVCLFQVLSVLFGAPVRGSAVETLQLSCLLSVLVVVPACLKAGVEGGLSLLRLGSPVPNNNTPGDDEFKNSALSTLAGAWCGGIVIPLDWDRPWQKWPLPCFGGALAGFFLFHALRVIRQSGILPFGRSDSREAAKL